MDGYCVIIVVGEVIMCEGEETGVCFGVLI